MNKTLPLVRSMLITGVVAVGIAGAWFMLASWFEGVIESALQGRRPFENVYLTVNGEPVMVRAMNGNTQTTEKILSLTGEPLKLTSQDLLYLNQSQGLEKRPRARQTLNWQSRLVAANDGGVPPTYWYLVHDGEDPGHAYGVGYHPLTQTIVGYFARNGFDDAPPPRDQWFDVAGHSGLETISTMQFYGQEPRWSGATPRPLLLADGKLWKIDLVKKQLIQLVDCPTGYRVGQAWRILENPPRLTAEGDQRSASSVTPVDGLVREPDSLLIIDPKSGESKRYPLPAEFRTHQLAAAQLPDGNLLLTTLRNYAATDLHVVWLTPSGEVARHQTVTRQLQWRRPSLAAVGWSCAGNAPLPLASAAMTFGWMPQMSEYYSDDEELDEDYAHALGFVLARTWPSILAVIAAACVAASLAYRRQKRFGLPNPAAWAVFAFVFGVPGWIAYRFHRVWPVLGECPACKELAPRDRETCFDCGKAFPPPPLKGIEVFA